MSTFIIMFFFLEESEKIGVKKRKRKEIITVMVHSTIRVVADMTLPGRRGIRGGARQTF